MCKGNCKVCKHLALPCRTIDEHLTCFCFECDKYGVMANSGAELFESVKWEIENGFEWLPKAVQRELKRQAVKV